MDNNLLQEIINEKTHTFPDGDTITINCKFIFVDSKMTMCVITLPNGFVINGVAHCACATRFDKEIGKSTSYTDAVAKLTEMHFYHKSIKEATPYVSDFISRMCDEKKELDERISKLEVFVKSDFYKSLDDRRKEKLGKQLGFMYDYSMVLGERILIEDK